MSAWILPDHVADVLPCEARHIEEIRRKLLDMARCYGYELVMPPLLEYLDSLLSGTGQALDLQTFKLVDLISGRSLGLRADSTVQVARIDAHLLNRHSVARLCYCGPVLHTQPLSPHATREPLQFGAEIYGHAGLEADLEILSLVLDALGASALSSITLDMADVRIVQALLEQTDLSRAQQEDVHAALAAKDTSALSTLVQPCPESVRAGLLALLQLYGDAATVLTRAREVLPALPGVVQALDQLQWLVQRIHGVRISLDLADLRGYGYYTGVRFSVYVPGCSDAIARGGRYDEVGVAFGRKRPAVGFSLDVKTLASFVEQSPLRAAIRAPWAEEDTLRQAIARLRQLGETVVCVLPGHDDEVDEFECDRELVKVGGQWIVQAIAAV